MSIDLPNGTQSIYHALRDAGIRGAQPLRNVSWITLADDGKTVMNIWRSQIEPRDQAMVAVVNARNWSAPGGGREKKRQAVVTALAALDGQSLRVIVLEERVPHSRKRSGARYYDGAEWLVEDTGEEFLLWRNRAPLESGPPIPVNPEAFGHVSPDRKEVISRRIERDPKVREFTLVRARNRCEIQGCREAADFATLDVHHMTRLGDGGADHTDNTVALCPACHLRVHRGTETVKASMEAVLQRVRERRR